MRIQHNIIIHLKAKGSLLVFNLFGMKTYKKTNPLIWTGRASNDQLYVHEKVRCIDLEQTALSSISNQEKTFALLGYACDEGVKRNHGRPGAIQAPNAIRNMIAKLSNHFDNDTHLIDVGDIVCLDNDLENTQRAMAAMVHELLTYNAFPIILGGGHDLAYAHFNGIKDYLEPQGKSIGIINLDAHFDLRAVTNKGTSGTPFYQIAHEAPQDQFHYLCLGIQKEANNRHLFETADRLGVTYLENHEYHINYWDNVKQTLEDFMSKVDHVYLTIDLDGFSSAFAPGVSAPSPFGFAPGVAVQTLKTICNSGKLISMDLVELNPTYDIDNSTARLASRLVSIAIEFMNAQYNK